MRPYVKKNVLLTLMVLVMIAANLYIAELILSYRDQNVYPSNLVLAGVPLAGTSREEALKSWPDKAKNAWGDSINLKWPGGVFNIPIDSWGIEYDTLSSLNKADRIVRGKKETCLHHISMRGKKQEVTPVFKWDEKRLQLEVVALVMKETIPKKAVDARLYCDNDGSLQFRAEEYGYEVDALGTYKNIAKHLNAGIIRDIEAQVKVIKPGITLDRIGKINELLNVEACKIEAVYPSWHDLVAEINGKAVLPGDILDLEKSLAEVPAFSYVLKSDKELLFSSLVKAWQGAGLKANGYTLINNKQEPAGITLNTEKNNILVIRVWGKGEDSKKKVTIKKEEKTLKIPVLIKIDPQLSPGEKKVEGGKKGKVVSSYKIILIDGKEKEKVLLWQEIEPAQATIVYYGKGTAVSK